jgi:hypothetical protein
MRQFSCIWLNAAYSGAVGEPALTVARCLPEIATKKFVISETAEMYPDAGVVCSE